jgi:hypothetical protein
MVETRVFEFIIRGEQLYRPPVAGSGQLTSLDDLRAQGWRPVHWERYVNSHGMACYRAIMEKGGKTAATRGSGEFKTLHRQTKVKENS